MQCTVCGREIVNENANYCDYCGASLRGDVNREVKYIQPVQQTTVTSEPKEERVPTSTFLGAMFMPLIPFVGTLVYLIYMFYWSFSPNVTDSRKSFGRATLICMAIALGVVIVIVGLMIAVMMAGYSSMM